MRKYRFILEVSGQSGGGGGVGGWGGGEEGWGGEGGSLVTVSVLAIFVSV